jgi:hypothetical protein
MKGQNCSMYDNHSKCLVGGKESVSPGAEMAGSWVQIGLTQSGEFKELLTNGLSRKSLLSAPRHQAEGK